ncbi:MAG: hypothetical protein ABIK28_20660 [Planctomycetota bacterium]
MKNGNERNEYDKMLDDVLIDEDLTAFRESLRRACGEKLKARKPATVRTWIIPLAAAAMLLVMLKVFFITSEPKPIGASPEENLLAEQRPSFFVAPSAFPAEIFLSSASIDMGDWICGEDPVPDLMVKTDTAPPIHVEPQVENDLAITDQEMLALFDDAPCGLVDSPGKGKTLIFMNAEDENRFMAKLD